ncbi:MAG: hypothetical protein ACIAS6_04535 [Phycisphaerales bacterium JB060]
MIIWLTPLIVATLVQDGPVPPERVDPISNPMPESNQPVPASDGRARDERTAGQAQDRNQRPARPSSRIDWSDALVDRPLNPRRHTPASIFTDEAYRRARVRALLEAAHQGRG